MARTTLRILVVCGLMTVVLQPTYSWCRGSVPDMRRWGPDAGHQTPAEMAAEARREIEERRREEEWRRKMGMPPLTGGDWPGVTSSPEALPMPLRVYRALASIPTVEDFAISLDNISELADRLSYSPDAQRIPEEAWAVQSLATNAGELEKTIDEIIEFLEPFVQSPVVIPQGLGEVPLAEQLQLLSWLIKDRAHPKLKEILTDTLVHTELRRDVLVELQFAKFVLRKAVGARNP